MNKYTRLLFSFFLLVCSNVRAQTPALDSLTRLYNKATSDTQRINIAVKKISEFSEINIDSAINLSNRTIAESQKINYIKGEADSRVKLARNLLFKGEYAVAMTNINTANDIYIKLKDSLGLASLYSTMGMYYGMQSRYDTSITYFKKTAAIATAKHLDKMLGNTYQNIATSYQMQSNYTQALSFYQKALKLAESTNDVKTQAYISMNLGLTYNGVGDKTRTEQYLLKAIKLADQEHIKNVELYAYSNLSTLYGSRKEFKQGYDAAIKASNLGKETGDIGMEASGLSRAGMMIAHLKQYDTAEIMGRHAIIIADSSNEPLNIYQTYSDYGSILKMQNKFSEALPYYEKAFSVIQKSDLYDNQVGQNYFDLSECYEQTGNYEKALSAYKKSVEIADSVKSKDNIRKATELALNYEFDKKQGLAKADQQKKDAIATARQTALIIGLLLTIALAGIALYAFSNKKKSNVLLKKQKSEIESTLAELKNTQAQLIQAEKMASLGELTAGIAHEIQNPLNFVNNFSEVNNELIEELKTEKQNLNAEAQDEILQDIFSNNEKIAHHGKRADAIVKSMLLHSRKNNGQKEPTDINALCDEYLRLSYHGLRAKDKSFNADFDTNFDATIGPVNIVPQDIGRVLLNLFNNAFYAVNEKEKLSTSNYQPVINVETKKLNNAVEIRVADNGNGIPQNVLDKIFQPFFTTKPTGEGTGLGLSMSYDIITKGHKGTITADTKQGEGTTFIIRLPIV